MRQVVVCADVAVTHSRRRRQRLPRLSQELLVNQFPVFGPDQSSRKLTSADVAKVITDPRAGRQILLLTRLLEGPITLRTASEFFKSGTEHRNLSFRINRLFRKHPEIRQNAILLRTLKGEPNPRDFWVMTLNPTVFELPPDYGNLQVGRHVNFVDILSPVSRKIFHTVADAGCCSAEHVSSAVGITKRSASAELSRINLECVEKGFPPPFLRTNTRPTIWKPNPAFIVPFSIPLKEFHGTLEDVFDEKDQKIIRCIVELGVARAERIAKAAGTGDKRINYYMKNIETRCREIGLPDPFVRTGESARMRYSMTESFAVLFKLTKTGEKLETYFRDDQIYLIKLIAENPYISLNELAERLGTTIIAVNHRIKLLELKCKQNGLPKLHKRLVGRNNEVLFRWNKAFLKRFALDEGSVIITRLLRGKELEVYNYWQGRDVVYGSEAAMDLELSTKRLSGVRRKANEKLKEFKLPLLKPPFKGKTRGDYRSIKEAVLAKRNDIGHWPRLVDLKDSIQLGINRSRGGLAKIMDRIRADITTDELISILEADLARSRSRQRNYNATEIVRNARIAGISTRVILDKIDAGNLDDLKSLTEIVKSTAFVASPMGASVFTTHRLSGD